MESVLGARRIAMEELVPLFWEASGLESAFGRSVEYQRRALEKLDAELERAEELLREVEAGGV
jgi:hypothetical protein